jgi:hypothetical protein
MMRKVVVNVWACVSCIESSPAIERLDRILAIMINDSIDNVDTLFHNIYPG